MENELDSKLIPIGYTYCFNTQCPKAANCLRQMASRYHAQAGWCLHVLNPAHYPAEDAVCPYFKSAKKVRIAWGITNLLEKVPYRTARQMRKTMIFHFTKTLYYRYYRQEYGIPPEAQEYIRKLFLKNGIQEPPVFDSYTEEYAW